MSLTAANALISLKDGAASPVNLTPGVTASFTPGNDLVFSLQNTFDIQWAQMTVLAPRYPGLHQLTWEWRPGQYNGWQITFPENTLVDDTNELAGLQIVVTVSDMRSSSVTVSYDLESNLAALGLGGALTAVANYAAQAGDVIANVGSGDVMGKYTAAIQALGVLPVGVVLFSIPIAGIVVYAPEGATVPTATLGVGAGSATWGVVNLTTAKVVRKDAPEANDIVMGAINTWGSLSPVSIFRLANSDVEATPPPYLATNDGSADASDALRTALAATPKTVLINNSSRPLRLASGDYIVNKPIHVKYTGGNEIFGEGKHATNIRNASTASPVFYVGPDRGEFPHLSNVFAGGAAITIRKAAASAEHWLPIGRSGAGHWFHGKSQWEARFIIRIINTTATDTTFILVSYGRRFSDEGAGGGYAEAWGVGYAGSSGGNPRQNTIFMTLTTTSGILSTYGNTNGLPADGNFHEVICNWSSGQMRIFIDGVQQTLSNSGALAGTIIQNSYESVLFGGGSQRFYGLREVSTTDFDLASFTLEAVVSRTSGYTPSGTKFTPGANTTMACNFDTYDGIFVVGSTRPTTASTSLVTAYWPHRQDEVAVKQMPEVTLHDFYITSLYGPAIECEAATRLAIRNVETLSKYGIIADNNCYISEFENIKCVSSGTASLPVAGIHFVSASNIVAFRNIATQDYDYHMVSVGSSDFTVCGYWYAAGKALVYLYACTFFSAVLDGNICFSDEASGSAPFVYIGIISGDTFTMRGANMGQSVASAGPLFHIQGDSGFGPLDIDVQGYFAPHSSSPGHFKVISSPTGLISARGHKNNSVPIATSGSSASARIIWEPLAKKTGTKALPDSNYTLTRDEHLNGHIRFTGTLTAGRSVFFPAFDVGVRSVFNATGQTLTFSITGGAVTWPVAAGAGATFAPNATATELDLVG